MFLINILNPSGYKAVLKLNKMFVLTSKVVLETGLKNQLKLLWPPVMNINQEDLWSSARLDPRMREALPPTARSRSQPRWPTWGRSTASTALQMLQTCDFAALNALILNYARSVSRRVQKSVITADGTATSRSTAAGSLCGAQRRREAGPAGKSSRCSMLSNNMDLGTGYITLLSYPIYLCSVRQSH